MLLLEQQITEYTSINIIERYPNWDEATTYNFGDIVFYGHYYYRSVIDENVGVIPPDDPSLWLRWGTSNRYAAIDMQAKTTTTCDADTIIGGVAPFDLVMEFENDRYDTIALGEIYGTTITIEVFKDPDYTTPYQTITKDMATDRTCVNSWYNYYYCPLAIELENNIRSLYYRLYPVQGRIRVTVTEGLSPYSSVGYMIAGQSNYVGESLYGMNMGVIDYSVKEYDDFGILNLLRRESRQTMDIDVLFDSTKINYVNRLARDVLGKVILFINDESADSQYEHLLLLGLLDDFTTVLSNPIKTQASFQISEVI